MEVARSCAASSKYKLPRGIKKKLHQLAQDLGDIKCFLKPASMGFVNDPTWLERLWQLKEAIHDAEEILDLFELQILEVEAPDNLKEKKKKKTKRYSGGASTSKGSLDKLVKVLDNLREKAGELHRDPHRLVHVHAVVPPMLTRAETGPVPVRDKSSFFGYEKEFKQLVSMLVKQHGDKDTMSKVQQIIAIVGHGGMGKTELARQAFRDVKGEFDLQIWVHAYDKHTEFDLVKEIWKSVAGNKPVGDMNLACLQRELGELLASKRCLLVLDDVWNHERAGSEVERKQAWAALVSFTRFVKDGSKIVMTTRAKICSTTLGAAATIVLEGIKPDEMITLLLKDTAKLGGDDNDTRIKDLLNEQLTKLKGSPLAAVEIGEELRKQAGSHRRCSNILTDIENHMDSVFSGHFFTYHHLPPHLQRCFAFCSIFPYKWRFQPEKLARMWIAHGFVEEETHRCSPCGQRSMEDLAMDYFDSLVDRSLFQVEEGCSMGTRTDQGGNKTYYYVIHEQIHWMLRLASARNCISISGAASHSAARNIPPTVRHLSVTRGCLDRLTAQSSITLANLRTLVVLKDNGDDDPSASSYIDKDVLGQFKGVRVLDLTEIGITELPGSIGKLKHVRYLGLPSTITSLCDQVTRLLFLQTLSVGDKRNKAKNCLLQMFPKGMSRLINMRHLDIDTGCIAYISGIGRLVKLQGSIEFQVMKGSEEEGHSLSELAGMNSLGGTLSIKGLDAVASKEEAEQARLVCKGSVQVLKLQWGAQDGRPAAGSSAAAAADDPAVAVLEGLQPHSDLRDLRITRRLQALPAVGALPCLELLDIKELTSIERIDAGFCGGGMFRKLKKILLEDMPVLVAWCDMPKLAFPQLTEVSVVDCPLLTSLSGLECCRCPLNMRIKGCPAITPHTLPAFRNRAQCHKFLGPLPKGLEDGEKCIELNPTYLMGYLCKAKVQPHVQNY
ncbi:unnamed protein product [Alopecurus aequalis]